MEITHELWIGKALEVHSTISLKISTQFILVKGDEAKRKALKLALALIDQLDFLLEALPSEEEAYKTVYKDLFALLKTLGLYPWAIDTLSTRFGRNSFFVREALLK